MKTQAPERRKKEQDRRTRQPSPNGLGRRAWKKGRSQEKILKEALSLFQKKGFEGATTKEIARRAGVAEGTIFNYFKTKEDIALYFFKKETERVIAALQDDQRFKRAPLEEQIFTLIQRQLEFMAPYERFIGAVLVQALKPASKLSPFSLESQELQVRYLRFVQGLFEEASGRGEIGPMGWWAPQVFWAYYMGVLLYWLNDASPDKESTLAFLDRSLKIGGAVLKKGAL